VRSSLESNARRPNETAISNVRRRPRRRSYRRLSND
jgi:hypothetical protein